MDEKLIPLTRSDDDLRLWEDRYHPPSQMRVRVAVDYGKVTRVLPFRCRHDGKSWRNAETGEVLAVSVARWEDTRK